ncbi:MAG TPA: hypothetical protein VJ914_14680 [Pseudonocardiaceae bacterium]|nr:hypothetical protein [Pseudonocardiaceae bacterium]
MGLVLPGALTWVLDMIGIDWPNIDEDELRSVGDELRQIAGDMTGTGDKAKSDIEQMLSSNSSQSLDLFNALWSKVAGSHLPQLAEALKAFAGVLDAAAVVVVGMKAAAIAQLAILAAEIISDQAEVVVTFGASEAEIPLQVAATRGIVKEIFDQAIKQFEQQLIQAVEGPIFDALGSAAEEMAGQLLGDALGTGSGLDLGAVASAAGGGFQQGVDSVASDPAGTLGLTTGASL